MSIHVVDVSRGIVARGMNAALWVASGDTFDLIVSGTIGPNGLLTHPRLSGMFGVGRYRVAFDVGGYYHASGIATGAIPFLGVVNYDFGIADAEQHIHLPFKCTPWGYSCFRGGE